MTVSHEKQGHVSIITMQREEKRNAIDPEMTAGLDQALNAYEDDPDLWVAVLTGGPRMFSAGTDLSGGSGPLTTRGGEYGLIRRHRTKPLIAAVEGLALGGGLELTFCCDIIIAADNVRLGLPEVKRGVIATSGALFRAVRSLPLHIASEVLLTGVELDPQLALQYGLVNRLVEPGTALDAAMEMARVIESNSPVSVQQTVQALDRVVGSTDGVGWEATRRAKAIVEDSQDRSEGVRAFFEKRQPVWSGR